MNYSEAMDYIEKTNQLGSVPGLDSIRELCRRLGNPQDGLKFVHVAGTNGKGSTLAYISTVLSVAGYRTGRYTSPAVSDYRERFWVDGKMIAKPLFSKLLSAVAEAADAMEADGFAHPTSFEIETAVAFLFFLEKKGDIVVLETGMGGLLDATNLITTTLVSVLASVSMDHMQFLGKTLGAIAGQKAGIIKPGCVAVSMRQEPEATEVIRRTCEEQDVELVIADATDATNIKYGFDKQRFSYDGYRNLEISLAGRWQIENAVLAVKVIGVLGRLGFPVAEEALRKGLRETVWQGRYTVLAKKPLFVVDGAHNEDASRKLAQTMEQDFAGKHKVFIMGILRDKEYEKIIRNTAPLADQIITVAAPGNPRAMSSYELAQEIRAYQPNVTAADSLEEAVEMAYLFAMPESVIIAFGSLSYQGRMMELVRARNERGTGKRKK